jgi:iron-sulfur cluster assembly accessory protein
MITVTPKAVAKIREQFTKHGVQGGLRLGVLGGGCSGLSYLFKFDVKPRPTDEVYEFEDVKVFVDPKSRYSEELAPLVGLASTTLLRVEPSASPRSFYAKPGG